MTRLPIAARLCPREDRIDARTIVRRIQQHFPQAVIDWDRGDEKTLRGIEWLGAMNVPEVIVEAKRNSLGQVAYVSITDGLFPGKRAWFYANYVERDLGDCLDLYSEPVTDIAFLKHLASEIAAKIGFVHSLSTDSTWGLEIQSEPVRQELHPFARSHLPEHLYPALAIRRLPDWRTALGRAVPLWFEKATFKSKQDMIERAGSMAAVAGEMIDALMEIDEVEAAATVDVAAPFHNSLILQHDRWMSVVSLSGAPSGILG